MRRSEQREKYIIYTAAILLCFVMASFWLLGNIYARYITEASGKDGARVAKFEVTEAGNATKTLDDLMLSPGETKEYSISVINKSEVTIIYEIDIENIYKNLPLKIKVLDSNDKEIAGNREEVQAGDTNQHIYKLQISWPKNASDEETDYQSESYAGKTDQIEIILRAVQKD